MDIKSLFTNINRKDAIILGIIALLIIGVVIAAIIFIALNWKWIVGIGVVVGVIAAAIYFILKYLKSKKSVSSETTVTSVK